MRSPLAIAVLALAAPLPAAAQSAAGALGVTAVVRAMPAPDLADRPALAPLRAASKPQDAAEALAEAAFRPGAAPDKSERALQEVEVRPPDGYDQAESFEFKATKIAYKRRF